MADRKTTELASATNIDGDDLLMVVVNPSTNAENKKVSVDNLFAYQSPTLNLTVSNSNDLGYRFTSPGVPDVNNPTLYVYRGFTYVFDTTNVPLSFTRTDGTDFTSGITRHGNKATFIVPHDGDLTRLTYKHPTNASMTGSINIV